MLGKDKWFGGVGAMGNGDDDVNEKTKYRSDPVEDVARRAANSFSAASFCSRFHHPSS